MDKNKRAFGLKNCSFLAESYLAKQLIENLVSKEDAFRVIQSMSDKGIKPRILGFSETIAHFSAPYSSSNYPISKINNELLNENFVVQAGPRLGPERRIWNYKQNGSMISVDYIPSQIENTRPMIKPQRLVGRYLLKDELSKNNINSRLFDGLIIELTPFCEEEGIELRLIEDKNLCLDANVFHYVDTIEIVRAIDKSKDYDFRFGKGSDLDSAYPKLEIILSDNTLVSTNLLQK